MLGLGLPCRAPESCLTQPSACLSMSLHSCNASCPAGFYGNNCSVPCECPEGLCHPVSGSCQPGFRGRATALLAGILVPLLLLFLGLACCACCCWTARSDLKDRPARDGTTVSRMKLQVWGTLTSLHSSLPCSSLSAHKLPWVTVSHHDPDLPFNHSFIEPPSAGWASDDSFSSDSESAEADEAPAYCVPPQEGMVPAAQAQSSEASLAGGAFPPPEDTSTPFAIPRTSSLARAKRPSVSFAEGTKFVSQTRRSSGELSSPLRKPKRLSRGAQAGPEGQEAEESTGPEEAEAGESLPKAASPGDSPTGHRRPPLGGPTVTEHVEAIEGGVQEASGPVTTIYVLAGTPRGTEGPVRSVLRHFGGFQKGQAEPKVKRAIPKPPRQALNRKKGSPGVACVSQSLSSAPNARLPGAMGSPAARPEEVAQGLGAGTESSGGAQEPVSAGGSPEQDPQKQAEEERQEEPEYENVMPIPRLPEP
ncbi:Scavenger receptor class F member 1 [Saguinus oedipus]|uniref:Scavenger receptor class F member 1 n=1 Tax=Saguinus oedipus TaxID=9490 RepID=A0ABQ9VME6_SAGOE|nr:Scavenger receptor class F member 1 [Saguinus oedipus]